jgi:hypothetical protein
MYSIKVGDDFMRRRRGFFCDIGARDFPVFLRGISEISHGLFAVDLLALLFCDCCFDLASG